MDQVSRLQKTNILLGKSHCTENVVNTKNSYNKIMHFLLKIEKFLLRGVQLHLN